MNNASWTWSIMSEENRKGISLRTKRKVRPAISAPKQISGPIQSSAEVPRSNGGKPPFEPPPQARRGKVCLRPDYEIKQSVLTVHTDVRPRKETIFLQIQQPAVRVRSWSHTTPFSPFSPQAICACIRSRTGSITEQATRRYRRGPEGFT